MVCRFRRKYNSADHQYAGDQLEFKDLRQCRLCQTPLQKYEYAYRSSIGMFISAAAPAGHDEHFLAFCQLY